MTSIILLISFIIFLLVWSVLTIYFEHKTEKPAYRVLEKRNGYEIREYESFLKAQIIVEGNYIPAVNRAFGPLVDYIYGDNVLMNPQIIAGGEKTVLFGGKGVRMKMVAPVMLEKISAKESLVSFALSKRYSEESIPKPNNSRIAIERVKPRKVAVKRFSWFATKLRTSAMELKLMSELLSTDKEVIGRPVIALYNPPFSAPFLNRNEILVEIA